MDFGFLEILDKKGAATYLIKSARSGSDWDDEKIMRAHLDENLSVFEILLSEYEKDIVW